MNATEVIAQIEAAGKSLYYIAKVLQVQYVQVCRMKKTGRCQPAQFKELEAIRDSVSRGTQGDIEHAS